MRLLPPLLFACVVGCAAYLCARQTLDEIDWDKARELRRRMLAGEKLSEEEQAYLSRARAALRAPRRPPAQAAATELTPLCDLWGDARYKGEQGGLYGAGSNEPPTSHLQAALAAARAITPLDAHGRPAQDGKVVLISVGMSNTTQEFSAFMRLARDDPARAPQVVIVDGAQGGMDALEWAGPQQARRPDRPDPWEVLQRRLQQAGVTPQQVQAAWIKQARRNPAALGEFPAHVRELQGHLLVIVQKLKERFPNLRVAYLSSRIYAGYARTALNPEPYAYESAFAVRGLIARQIEEDAELNHDPEQGEVRAPILLWGPYLWAAGKAGRKLDGLTWLEEDLAQDGTHPSASGQRKVAELLLRFMHEDPTARLWYVRRGP
jgi:hypothetical protein